MLPYMGHKLYQSDPQPSVPWRTQVDSVHLITHMHECVYRPPQLRCKKNLFEYEYL